MFRTRTLVGLRGWWWVASGGNENAEKMSGGKVVVFMPGRELMYKARGCTPADVGICVNANFREAPPRYCPATCRRAG